MTGNILHTASCAFGVALIIGVSEVLTGDRLTWISVLTVAVSGLFTFTWIHLFARRNTVPPEKQAASYIDFPKDPIGHRTLKHIKLATEHITSLLLVLRVAREYSQPIPAGALHNLALVDKELRSLQYALEEQLGKRTGAEQDWPQSDSDGRFQAPELRITR